MIKRTVEISREPAHLSIRDEQLLLKRDGQLVGQIPCEDLGILLVDHPQVSYTHAALAKIAESDAALVVCGNNHLPVAVLLPLADHSQVVWRIHDQLSASKPLRKQLWQQLIRAKVWAQAMNLPTGSTARTKLLLWPKKFVLVIRRIPKRMLLAFIGSISCRNKNFAAIKLERDSIRC